MSARNTPRNSTLLRPLVSPYHPSFHRVSSVEFLYPELTSNQRQATLSAAVFSLVSTIIGGGVLSLPYAFRHTGIILGIIYIILIALASNFSIYILISASRRAHFFHLENNNNGNGNINSNVNTREKPTIGINSYEELAYTAFGSKARILTLVLMLCLIYLAAMAYLILMRDLLAPLIQFGCGVILTPLQRSIALWLAVVSILPLCCMRSMNSLRFTSVISVSAMMILAVVICFRSIDRNFVQHKFDSEAILWVNTDISASLYAFPIISVAYLCHFNVLPLHSELQAPSRKRVRTFINWVIILCTTIYTVIGIFGYLFALNLTDGNILNNFHSDDHLITIGRLGLLFTIIFSFPLLILPARNTSNRLLIMAQQWAAEYFYEELDDYNDIASPPQEDSEEEEQSERIAGKKPETVTNNINHENGSDLLSPNSILNNINPNNIIYNGNYNNDSNYYQVTYNPAGSPPNTGILPGGSSTPVDLSHFGWNIDFQNLAQTIVIVFTATFLAMFITSVATLWSILGSSVSILIAYILPAAFYLKIRAKKDWNIRKLGAWLLLIFGVVALFVCSGVATYAIIYPTAMQ
jgi:amino acid permease